MKLIRDKVAGLDVHRDTVVACCRLPGPRGGVNMTKRPLRTTSKESPNWPTGFSRPG